MVTMIKYLLAFSAWYLVLFLLIPAVVLYPYAKKRPLVVRLVFYQVIGLCYLTVIGFILAFTHLFYRSLLIITLMVLPIALRLFLERKKWVKFLIQSKNKLRDQKEFYGGYKKILREINLHLKGFMKSLYIRYLKGNILTVIVFLGIIAFAISVFGYYKAYNSGYAYTDEETHLYWIQSLTENNPFPAGMYPHTMHFIVASIGMISKLQIVTIWHYFSVFSFILILCSAYAYTRTLFESRGPALLGVGFFTLTGIFQIVTFVRFQYSVPMEFAYSSMFAMLVSLHLFIHKKGRFNFIFFVSGFFLTFHTHFYIAIFSLFACVAYGLVYLIPLIKSKRLHKILLSGILAVVLSIAPFACGMIAGFSFERSIAWALAIMNGDDETKTLYSDDTESLNESDDTTETDAENETVSSEEIASESETSTDTDNETQDDTNTFNIDTVPDLTTLTPAEIVAIWNQIGTVKELDNLLVTLTPDEYQALLSIMDESTYQSFESNFYFHYELSKIHSISDAVTFVEKLLTYSIVHTNSDALFLIILSVLTLIYGLGAFIFGVVRRRTPSRVGLLVFFIWLFCMFCHWMPLFYLPAILHINRAASAAAVMCIPLFGMPAHIVISTLKKLPGNMTVKEQLVVLGSAAILGSYYYKGDIKTIDDFYYNFAIQNADMDLCLDLLNNHEDFSWTVISLTNDLSVLRTQGYHYEIIDLLQKIEDGIDTIYIPTPDVYVVIEKKAVNFGLTDERKIDDSDFLDFTLDLDPQYVNMSLYDLGLNYLRSRDRAYYDLRLPVMTKLYYWMEKFKEKYPSDYTIYSEDEKVIVYHIHQDPYFLLNFALDYSIPEGES